VRAGTEEKERKEGEGGKHTYINGSWYLLSESYQVSRLRTKGKAKEEKEGRRRGGDGKVASLEQD